MTGATHTQILSINFDCIEVLESEKQASLSQNRHLLFYQRKAIPTLRPQNTYLLLEPLLKQGKDRL